MLYIEIELEKVLSIFIKANCELRNLTKQNVKDIFFAADVFIIYT